VRRYDLWRGFVFDLLSHRLSIMLAIVDEVAFRRMDARLANFLLNRSQIENPCASLTRKSRLNWAAHARSSAGYWRIFPTGDG